MTPPGETEAGAAEDANMLRDNLQGSSSRWLTAREFFQSVVITKQDKPGDASRSTEFAIAALKRSWRQFFRRKTGRRAENGNWPGVEVTAASPDSRAVGTAQHQSHRTIDPQCLRKSPPRRGGIFSLTENVPSPVRAEPRQQGVSSCQTSMT
jgi:hypothetical protein